MKLTIFAIAAVGALLLAAGYLTIKSDFEEKMQAREDTQRAMNEKMLESMQDLKANKIAEAAATVSPAPPVLPIDAAAPAPAVVTNPTPAVNPVAAVEPRTSPPVLAPGEQEIIDLAVDDRMATDIANQVPDPDGSSAPLTAMQRSIIAQPKIAAVKEFSSELGAVVLNAGSVANLKPGGEFSLRRNFAIIGRIRISETVNTNECVADVIPGTMPLGMTPQPGDEAILFTAR